MFTLSNKHIRIAFAAIVFSLFCMVPVIQVKAQQSSDFEFSKNLDIFFTLCKELNSNYVDNVDPSKLVKTGIDAMLDDLDPYTVYIPESEIEDYRFITTGEYGGIGAVIHKQGNSVYIDDPYENAPAMKAGLKAGDRILEINSKSATGKTVEEVSSVLKGQPGSVVKLKVERPGESKPFEKEVIREKISVDCVPYYGMISQQTGYIKLTSFTQTASAEVKNALLQLKKNPDLKNLVLDIRNNGGGLLTEAVSIVNLFVEKGHTVVSTKGKQPDKNKTYKTSLDPIDTEIPLIVLVNDNSASASEIVAGALQDLDRGVIVGQRTYGKGLVQNIIPLSYNTQVKITVAKYYIPSGRCIQAIDYSHKNANGTSEIIPDSLITAFKTLHGRIVYDGKGVLPDVKSDTVSLSPLAISLLTKYLIFDFATKYAREHPVLEAPDKFLVDETTFKDFVGFLNGKQYDYSTRTEKEMSDLKQSAQGEKYWNDIKDEFKALELKMKHNKTEDLENNRPEILQLLKYEIVGRYYYQKGQIIASIADDQDIKKCLDTFSNSVAFSSILSGIGPVKN